MMKNYYKPTPVKYRKIGDALLYACGTISATGLIGFNELKEIFGDNELKIIVGSLLIIGFVGKFLSNLFKVDEPGK